VQTGLVGLSSGLAGGEGWAGVGRVGLKGGGCELVVWEDGVPQDWVWEQAVGDGEDLAGRESRFVQLVCGWGSWSELEWR
jgi:hypothetical protein